MVKQKKKLEILKKNHVPEKQEKKEVKEEKKQPETLEDNLDFSPSFEPTKEATPIIKEKPKEEVKDIEQFLEKVPTKKEKEEDTKIYAINENYVRDVYSEENNLKYEINPGTDEESLRRIQRDLQESKTLRVHPTRRVELQEETMTQRKGPIKEAIKYDLHGIRDEGIKESIFEDPRKKYEIRSRKNRRI